MRHVHEGPGRRMLDINVTVTKSSLSYRHCSHRLRRRLGKFSSLGRRRGNSNALAQCDSVSTDFIVHVGIHVALDIDKQYRLHV